MGVYVVTPKTQRIRASCKASARLCVLTDAARADALPSQVLAAADDVRVRSLPLAPGALPDDGQSATLTWMEGEVLLCGTSGDLRRCLYHTPPMNSLVVVHLPFLEGADLLSLQPRIQIPGATAARMDFSLRISANASPSPSARKFLDSVAAPWARLHAALLAEIKRPSAALDPLRDLWQQCSGDPQFSALILRNLILVLIRQQDFSQAEKLLELAATAFPGYAEIPYLHALLWVQQKKFSKAVRFLESALKLPATQYPGGGGGNSYRALWMLGSICELSGDQERAVQYWAPSVNERPAFQPAVDSLLNQRIPKRFAARFRQPLGELARREPSLYLEKVVAFFTAHDLLEAARLLTTAPGLADAKRAQIQSHIDKSSARLRTRAADSSAKPGIIFSGAFLTASGHARTNRALAFSLLDSKGFDAGLDSHAWPTLSLASVSGGETLWNANQHRPDTTDLTIRHVWPPDFERPCSGKLVCIVPWEHRAVPRGWVRDIEDKTDELWLPSEFVRQAFVSGGVSPHRAYTLSNGVDTQVFRPDGLAFRPPGARGFVFLFVGGTIRRKGIDLLLRAYGDAFTSDDNVTLVIKDLGSGSFYAQNTLLGEVMDLARRPGAPHTIVLTTDLDDASLAALYRGANAFVLPYRGEGFAMPLVEAMACNCPVISTAAGPVLEYCSPDDAFLVPAVEVAVPDAPPPLGEFSAPWTWFEPDIVTLAQTMRDVFGSRDAAKTRAARAGERVRKTLAWEQVLPAYHQRIAALTGLKDRPR